MLLVPQKFRTLISAVSLVEILKLALKEIISILKIHDYDLLLKINLPVAHNAPIKEINKFNFGTNSAIVTEIRKRIIYMIDFINYSRNLLQVNKTISVLNINSYFMGFLNGPNF